jgi:hypothetical protein
MRQRPTTWRRPADPEFSDRPYVRDIYAAQRRGFPIFDSDAFETYRIALTSVRGLDDPEAEEILRPLAQQARTWMARHTEPRSRPGWFWTDKEDACPRA